MTSLDLWGTVDAYIEEEIDPEQEAAEKRLEKRKRGVRSPSPISTGRGMWPKLVHLVNGKNFSYDHKTHFLI